MSKTYRHQDWHVQMYKPADLLGGPCLIWELINFYLLRPTKVSEV